MIILRILYHPRAPKNVFGVFFVILVLIISPMRAIALVAPEPYQGLPDVTLALTGLDDSGELIYIGIDIAVFEETDAVPDDPNDVDGDGKVFRVKDGKVKRIMTSSTNISVDLGSPSDYKKAVKHKLAMRILYTPVGAGTGEIIIANWNNGKDGWVEVPGSLFQLSYFEPIDGDSSIIKHTPKWEENRSVYNQSKIDAGIVPNMTQMRPENTFWPGERLLIEVRLSEPVEALKIGLYDDVSDMASEYETAIFSYAPDPDTSGGAIYTGEMWSADMINKWGNYEPKAIAVKAQAIVSGAAVETSCGTIIFDNKDQFYRITKTF